MTNATRERFDDIWKMISLGVDKICKPPNTKLRNLDALHLLHCGIIRKADDAPTRAWVNPFSVVEYKSSGWRRRFIAWPKRKNETEVYDPQVPLQHISTYLQSVLLPGGCSVLFGTLAGVRSRVAPIHEVPTPLRVDVWIDNIRICGEEGDARHWGTVMEGLANLAQVTFGDMEKWSRVYTFLGVKFNHIDHTVCVGDKAVQHLEKTPAWDLMRVTDLEVFASRTLFAAAVLGIHLFEYYVFFKFVRLTLQRLNR
eukprot:gene11143-gene9072